MSDELEAWWRSFVAAVRAELGPKRPVEERSFTVGEVMWSRSNDDYELRDPPTEMARIFTKHLLDVAEEHAMLTPKRKLGAFRVLIERKQGLAFDYALDEVER